MDNQISSEKIWENLKTAAADASSQPGVYIMKDEDGRIIYVGKAKSLKNRLRSYFTGEKDIKTATLTKRVRHIESIIVKNEYEALLLENTLIKQHSPKYNINLKDGKTYPVVRVTREDFPRAFRTRVIVKDGSLYFGPFPNASAVDAMMELIDRNFPLRKCKRIKKNGPCVYYHMGRCMAPCRGKINAEEYGYHVQQVIKLLSGQTESLLIDLTSKMHEEAKDLRFEKAAEIRNTINAIENLTSQDNYLEDHNAEDRDYIAWAAEGVFTTFTVFSMRGGKMTGRDLFRARSAADEIESLEQFIISYYENSRPPPAKIFLQANINTQNTPRAEEEKISDNNSAPADLRGGDFELILDWFKEKFGRAPELLTTTEKRHEAILAMARQNAVEDLRKRMKERGAGPVLDELAKALDLAARPERIEGFDISHLEGRHPVASLISFKNGVPDRKNYRRFKLRSVIGKPDDFAAMREVVKRRYSRLLREGTELPDLILVDGGVGQVNAAKTVLDELGIVCSLAGLAKREEEIWLAGAKDPIVLSRQSEALKILQHVRDECHRAAIGFNKKLRAKDLFFPILESVEGIGPRRAAAIMKAYENIANIAAADTAEMAKKCGITENSARAVRACARLAMETR